MAASISELNQQQQTEQRFSVRWVALTLIVFGTILVLTGDARTDAIDRLAGLQFAMAFFALAGAIWGLDLWRKSVSQWFTIATLIALIFLGILWQGIAAFMFFLTLPIALTVALVNLRWAGIITAVESGLLLLIWPLVMNHIAPQAMIAALTTLWLSLGLLYAIYHPMAEQARWSLEHFEMAQKMLEEARDQKAELEQTLDDLAHANRELALLNERLATMRMIAEEAQKTKSAFVSKVSHEFRTPLNMIIGLTDLLIETPDVYGDELSPELVEDLKIVHRNCEHLSSMINDVLDLSQTEMGRLTLHLEWVNLTEDINNALMVVHPLMDKKSLELTMNIAPNLSEVYCDRTRIRQVILNLVSNAARYTETGGITVNVVPEKQNVVVSVTDTGPGIAPGDIARIFDPFFQGTEHVWRDQAGSGLGLSISKQFVELHSGKIWVESKLGEGSTFAFRLPVAPPSMGDSESSRWTSEDWVWFERTSWPKVPSLPRQRRVLICDETGDLSPMLTRYFEDIEFISAQTLPETVKTLTDRPAHAVMVNTASPNNLTAAMEQARQQITDTPIIGCAFPPQIHHVLTAGAINYLIKPVSPNALRETLAQIDFPLEKVLIVDDHPDIRQLFRRMLAGFDSSLTVFTAPNGQESLGAMARIQPDLVLLDIVMPEMDGWQVLEEKQKNAEIRDIPVILVSAQDLATQPMTSNVLQATIGAGLSLSKTLACSLKLSEMLLEPDS